MDELVITCRRGEAIDPFLVDQNPVRGTEVIPYPGRETVCRDDVWHGPGTSLDSTPGVVWTLRVPGFHGR